MTAISKIEDILKKVEDLKKTKAEELEKAHESVLLAEKTIEEKKQALNDAIEGGDAKSAASLAAELAANDQIAKSLQRKEETVKNKCYLSSEEYANIKAGLREALSELEAEKLSELAKHVPALSALVDDYYTQKEKASAAIYSAYIELASPAEEKHETTQIKATIDSTLPAAQYLPVYAIETLKGTTGK